MAAMIDAGGTADGPPPPPPLRPAEPGRKIPLTFPQERIWLLEQISPGNIAYQAQAVLRLRGPLDIDILTTVLNDLVYRHDAFRTRFTDDEGEPVQQVLPAMRVEVPVVDLSGLTPAAREAKAEQLIEAEVRRPFPIDEPPLVRWTVIRYGPQDHSLLHVEHHLAHDGWSFSVFYEELTALYEAYLAKAPSPLPEPRLRFADLAAWQHDWLRGPTLARYVNHWTARLAGAPTLDLPVDRPRPAEFSFRGAAHRFQMSADEYRGLRACAREHGVTLYSVMFAGFAALLARYSGQEDFMVGAGVANRRTAEAERLVGMVVNTLPLRADLSGDPSLPELLRRVHAVRDLSRNALFTTIFSFHDSAMPVLDFGGIRGDVTHLHNGSAKAEFNVVVIPRAEQRAGRAAPNDDLSMTVIWEYATDVFDAATVERLAGAYRALLAEWTADPAMPLSRLAAGHLPQRQRA
jgi:Condensation domain